MKIYQSLQEKRSHPELNVKKSAWEDLLPYKDDEDIFITFTDLEKVGVNPRTKHSTPAGVYFYPLKESWKEYGGSQGEFRPLSDVFPYAGDSKFVNVYRLINKSRILFTSKLNKSKIKEYADRLLTEFDIFNRLQNGPSERNSIEYSKMRLVIDRYETNRTDLNNMIAGIFNYLNIRGSTFPVFLTHCYKNVLGLSGIVDDAGTGFIHGHEAVQAVFFQLNVLKPVKTIPNRDPIIYRDKLNTGVSFLLDLHKSLDLRHRVDFKKYNKFFYESIITGSIITKFFSIIPNENYGFLNELHKRIDDYEDQKVSDFILGLVYPCSAENNFVGMHEVLNLFYYSGAALIKNCQVAYEDLFNFNIYHIAAKLGHRDLIRSANIRFDTPFTYLLEDDYNVKTPYQVAKDDQTREFIIRFLSSNSKTEKMMQDHPEAFS